jgi:hypothetical protein
VLGVKEFQQKYFKYPVYQDAELSFYKAMGTRKLYSLFSWNPLTWFSALSDLGDRYRDVTGNLKGEGIVLGGVLVISKEKGVVYQYDEITGQPLPLEDITRAVEENTPK